MSEVHKKIHGLCYKAQVPPRSPNWVLMGYLKTAQLEKEYQKEWARHVIPEGKTWLDLLEYTFCVEHSELENV